MDKYLGDYNNQGKIIVSSFLPIVLSYFNFLMYSEKHFMSKWRSKIISAKETSNKINYISMLKMIRSKDWS